MLIAVAAVALLASPAFGAGVGTEEVVAVSASIAKYATVDVTDGDIIFTTGDMGPQTEGPVVAADTAILVFQANAASTITSDNGAGLTGAGSNSLPTKYSSQFLGGPVMIDGGGPYTMGSTDWTPFGTAGVQCIVDFEACNVYTATIRCQVERDGLADPADDYSDTMTLTLTAL